MEGGKVEEAGLNFNGAYTSSNNILKYISILSAAVTSLLSSIILTRKLGPLLEDGRGEGGREPREEAKVSANAKGVHGSAGSGVANVAS